MNGITMRGFTLAELLVTLTITTLLIAMAVPGFGQWQNRSTLEASRQHVRHLVNYVRTEAIRQHQVVTLCQLESGSHCQSDTLWSETLTAFVDRNANRQIDGNDTILRTLELKPDITVHWKAFNGKGVLQINPGGAMRTSNGTLSFCRQDTEAKLVVSRQARMRHEALTASHCPA